MRGQRRVSMDKLAFVKRVGKVTFATVAIILAVVGASQAQGAGGRGVDGGHTSTAQGHPTHDGGRHGADGHHHDGAVRRDFDRGHHRFIYRPYLYWSYPYYYPYSGYSTPTYYWYCPAYGNYYPNVQSCPEEWVAVPAS
jgi:hypothetical protein